MGSGMLFMQSSANSRVKKIKKFVYPLDKNFLMSVPFSFFQIDLINPFIHDIKES
jgi:hypothetical protein